MRLLESALSGWRDPAAVFAAVYGAEPHAVWLDSGGGATGGVSYLGAGARRATAYVAEGTVTIDGVTRAGTALELLRSELERASVEAGEGFRLGWVGWLGYELRAQTMGTPPGRRSRYPDAALLFVDRAIVLDHSARSMRLIALGDDWTGELAEWREAVTARIAAAEPVVIAEPQPTTAAWATSDADYLEAIRRCQAAIVEGDAYQLCLTNEARVDGRHDPLATYLALRAASPSHHGVLVRFGEHSLLGSSPEQFLSVSPAGVVESKPIKGTRRRGVTQEEDAALARELEASDKERAENLMIVDLMRNDIGRVSEIGSVAVPSLLAVESYAQVHQLVSTVRGRLAPGIGGVDAVAACFPAGSMTGAPKHSAVALLDGLERRARGVYAGAVGYFGLDGRIDLAMVIRSIVLDDRGATVGAGGGITALSVPEEELEEMHLKAAVLLAVLGVTESTLTASV